MEQFKQLKWSWHKYEEDKQYLERNFSFETINDNDALSRNLNEVHTCVIPQQNGYRIFKTPEEIEANYLHIDDPSEIIELKDPRRNTFCKLESSDELIKDYSYSSELKKHEHIKIISSLMNNTVYNPKLIRNPKLLGKSTNELPKELIKKWQVEADQMNRCAEIYYHRHITKFNNLICDKFKDILFHKWKRLEAQFPYLNCQAITMIVRNQCAQSSFNITINHIESLPITYQRELYGTSDNFFQNLYNVSVESINLFTKSKEIFMTDNELTEKANIQISLNTLTKLFVDGTEFNALFINEKNCTKFKLHETIPLKTAVAQCDAMEESIKLIIQSNIEWYNANKFVGTTLTNRKIDFKLCSINETMSKIFKSYKKHAGVNNEISLWSVEKNSQKLLISVCTNAYYIRQDDYTRIIVSIKFEYQTNFGAEIMTREELLKEWIQIKFSLNSIIMRFRIDMKSLEILSIKELTIDDIESELKDNYNYDPLEAMNILCNVFNCIHNLPQSRYIIQGQQNDKECNKLMVYKEVSEHGKNIINDEDFKISETFTRKWLPVDKKIITFVHINEEIGPCCFSYKSPQKVSYIASKTKKEAIKKIVGHKSPHKTQNILRKRTRRKRKNVKKITVNGNLN